MLDIRKIKENPDAVKAGLKAKEVDCDAIIDKILELDVQVRGLKTSTETRTAQKNKISKENGKLFGMKKGLEKKGGDTAEVEAQIAANIAAVEEINTAKSNGHKVVAIGTTVMRAMETAVTVGGKLKPMEGWTNKFIFHPYQFTSADAMVSNFHLPYSTQLMMVAAFGGYDMVMDAYRIAKEEGYRFGTYGDAMLIL